MDGQIEVTNRALGTLLRVLVKKSIKRWDELNCHTEFAFNCALSKATNLCPFQVVYGNNPRTPLDLFPIPNPTKFSWEAKKGAKEIQDLHAKVTERIKKFSDKPSSKVTSIERKFIFILGTWFGSTEGRKDSQVNASPSYIGWSIWGPWEDWSKCLQGGPS